MRVSRRLTSISEELAGAPLFEEGASEASIADIPSDLIDTITTLFDRSKPSTSQDIDFWSWSRDDLLPLWAWFWPEAMNLEKIARPVRELRAEIIEIREKTRPFLEPIPALENNIANNGTYAIDPDRLALVSNGVSGSYFLSDETGKNRFIVKPFDEDIAGLNNPKGFGSPIGQFFCAVFREIAVYETAKSIGVDSIAPPTALAILKSDSFFDLADLLPELGPADKEKLCSLQEFVPNSKTLFEAAQDLQQERLSDEEIAARFDQQDFENANILLWVSGETDGHMGNFLAYPKGVDELGHEILGLKKIDNGLSFPDENSAFFNALTYLPNARQILSEASREKILSINPDDIAGVLHANELEDSILPMRERIAFLKTLSLDPLMTIKEINQQITMLETDYAKSF